MCFSFLGLGVKYPFASWGNIINDVNNAYVMTNYLFIWSVMRRFSLEIRRDSLAERYPS